MASAGHQYDESLLASAPVATREQLQSGYTTDLLTEKATPPTSRRDLEAATTPMVVNREVAHTTPVKTPFYRTKKGIIIIVVVVLVIIAAVVGGAVGGSKKKNPQLSQDVGAPTNSTTTPNPTDTSNPQGGPSTTSAADPNATLPLTGLQPGFTNTAVVPPPANPPPPGAPAEVGAGR
ncbi:hypothetical protein B0H34DRAFT_799719 [Crassisporium funariophilum]|nr:hypothetical protein B0H34DRAFT_799719 [Crassisporium funariophilum]